jgi:MtN3 and saliva related transmembrane protein
MTLINLLGTAAALCSTISFTPQAWKIIKTRDTKDLSAGMYLLTVSAFALWAVYGTLQRQWPLVASNSLCFALSAFILLMKVLPQREKEAVADAILQKE